MRRDSGKSSVDVKPPKSASLRTKDWTPEGTSEARGFYPPGGSKRESWRSLFYANLVHSFISEILSDGPENEGNFEDGAHVQELINAVELSFRERRWVSIPLAGDRLA